MREQRLVMAEHLGRPLETWELIHHINHNRADNRIENLELIDRPLKHQAETMMVITLNRLKKQIKRLEHTLDKIYQQLYDQL